MDVWLATLVGAAALLVSGLLGWPVTAGVLRLAARSADAGGHRVPDEAPEPDAPEADAGSTTGARTADVESTPVTRRATRATDGTADVAPDPGVSPVGPKARAALRGGTWIGILERVAITACLLAAYPGGIAVVVAVKGLGRYPELREHPDVSERFVIGTFASMLWATGIGLAGQALLLR